MHIILSNPILSLKNSGDSLLVERETYLLDVLIGIRSMSRWSGALLVSDNGPHG